MNKKNIKIISITTLLSIIFFIGLISVYSNAKVKANNQTAQAINSLPETPKPESKTTTLFFVGDIMLTRGVKSSVEKNFAGDYSKLFENLSELKDADILFGNLEGDVSDKGNNVGSIYSFEMNPGVLPVLKDAGFDIVSFANNHVGDWSMIAFSDTLSRLEENGILKTGAGQNTIDASSPTIIEKNGTRFGFLGFSDVGPNWMQAKDDVPGILLASDPNLGNIIANAKTKCDVLIISFHWGVEYKTVHNARQEELAHTAIDNGADMIIGTHPHVMEDIGEYNGKPIVYSLGNFIFDQAFSQDTMRGMLFSATFDGANLKETNNRVITLNKQYQPERISSVEEIEEKDDDNNTTCLKPIDDFDDQFLSELGQEVKLPDINYVPKKLREIDTDYSTKKNVCLIDEAQNQFEAMAADAKNAGYIIKATSGFRSYETQKTLFENALKVNPAKAKISIAKPGYSEHQLGTAVDITGNTINYSSATSTFSETPEDLWLRDNAYLYGFVQSYPKGKEDATGYRYESWHYRYVGIDNAKKIKDSGLTITEFLKENI
jgi:poly-gamma-glutamate synthesis protein (capsule biosynthesis protein)